MKAISHKPAPVVRNVGAERELASAKHTTGLVPAPGQKPPAHALKRSPRYQTPASQQKHLRAALSSDRFKPGHKLRGVYVPVPILH
jgi:hypothetical protein